VFKKVHSDVCYYLHSCLKSRLLLFSTPLNTPIIGKAPFNVAVVLVLVLLAAEAAAAVVVVVGAAVVEVVEVAAAVVVIA
jgi:hypothetical protein